jgi:hypothetical protein
MREFNIMIGFCDFRFLFYMYILVIEVVHANKVNKQNTLTKHCAPTCLLYGTSSRHTSVSVVYNY